MSKRRKSSEQAGNQDNTLPAVPIAQFEGNGRYGYCPDNQSYFKRERFRSAYSSRGYRMYAPFLTQLSTQYDSVETANVERMERRRMAKKTYERDNNHRFSSPDISKRHDLKV